MNAEKIKMVGECTDRYSVSEREDGGVEIRIVAPRRFKNLWMVRLSELVTTADEINYYEHD